METPKNPSSSYAPSSSPTSKKSTIVDKKYIQGLKDSEILEGEQHYLNNEATFTRGKTLNYTGRLIMTNYKLIFVPDEIKCKDLPKNPKGFFKIPLGLISTYEKDFDKKSNIVYVDISTKDGRKLRFMFLSTEKELMAEKICKVIEIYVFHGEENYTFAFLYKPSLDPKSSIYNFEQEYKRMGLDMSKFKICTENKEWGICPSYPMQFIIPAQFPEKDLKSCAQLWNCQRLPILSYFDKNSSGSLWRSADFKVFFYLARILKKDGNSWGRWLR